jgi:hypothetical protein
VSKYDFSSEGKLSKKCIEKQDNPEKLIFQQTNKFQGNVN